MLADLLNENYDEILEESWENGPNGVAHQGVRRPPLLDQFSPRQTTMTLVELGDYPHTERFGTGCVIWLTQLRPADSAAVKIAVDETKKEDVPRRTSISDCPPAQTEPHESAVRPMRITYESVNIRLVNVYGSVACNVLTGEDPGENRNRGHIKPRR